VDFKEENLMNKLESNYPQYLTTGAVARHCGVSKVTVLRWIEKGNLVAFRLPSGQNRIHRDEFFAFAERHKIPLGNGHK
jgi:excisionase family DNA binding protein